MRVLVATISLRRNTKFEVIIPSDVVDVKTNLLSLAGSGSERLQVILGVAPLATDPSPGLVNASQAFTPLPNTGEGSYQSVYQPNMIAWG